jgi:hypothetical protein
MSSPTEIVHLSDIPTCQESAVRKTLDPDALLALRLMILLLDQWDREAQRATPVDTRSKSVQGERRGCACSTHPRRAK